MTQTDRRVSSRCERGPKPPWRNEMKFSKSLILFAIGLAVFNLNGCTCNRQQATEQAGPETAATPDENKAPDYSGITVNRVLNTEVTPGKGGEAKQGST